MKGSEVLTKDKVNNIIIVLFLLLIFSNWGINFLSLGNNLIFRDEGWYLYALRDCPRDIVTKTGVLFHNIFHNDIYAIRVTCWLIRALGAIFFAYSLIRIYQHITACRTNWCQFIIILGSICTGSLYLLPNPSLNYLTLNLPICEIGIGCMFLGFATRNKCWHLLSGFIISFLLPIMITNAVIIPLLLLSIVIISEKKQSVVYFMGWE